MSVPRWPEGLKKKEGDSTTESTASSRKAVLDETISTKFDAPQRDWHDLAGIVLEII